MIVFGSARGAPGVTTSALLVAASLPAGVVVEADVDGGTLAVRYGLGREPGLTTLAAARKTDAEAWRHHAQLAGSVPVVVGPDSPASAEALWARAGTTLVRSLEQATATIVVDAGRLQDNEMAKAVLPSADLVVVLAEPKAEHLVGLSHRLAQIRDGGTPVAVVTVGDGPYRPADIATQLDVEILGSLPADRRAAAILGERGGSHRVLARTSLARASRDLAEAIRARTGLSTADAQIAAVEEVKG
jgi:MinD-like ATPase involved in chromosome partitioning or flagellar assembly